MEINSRRIVLGGISLALTLFPRFSFAQKEHKENKSYKQPNIVFLLADDLGYGDIGVNGQKLIKTPNINRLASEGKSFSQFYAGCTVSAPSRSVIFTGLHTGHTYIRGNSSTNRVFREEGQEPISASITTLGELLKSNGYRTGAFGKWGLGPVGSEGDPNKRGFDRFFGFNCQGLAHRYYPNHLWDNDKKVILEENQNLSEKVIYAPDIIQQQALNFIETSDPSQPFFLYLPYTLPHAELIVPDDSIFQYYKGKFSETTYVGNDYGPNARPGGYTSQEYPHASFASLVTRLDRYLGEILEKLKEKGLDENTIVIFASDNGPHIEGGADPVFFNSGGGFRGIKRDLYEGGIRVPFIARWQGHIPANTKSDFIGAFWDILPTFVELAGGQTPKDLDGISIVPVLTDKGYKQTHHHLYWEFHERGGMQALRKDNWKLVRLNVDNKQKQTVELYDLSKDPAEQYDLATQHPDILTELTTLVDKEHTLSTLFPFAYEGE
jgi:arylsulfatase A-like enzyme